MKSQIKQVKEKTVQENKEVEEFEHIYKTQLDAIKNTVDMIFNKLVEIDLRIEKIETNQKNMQQLYDSIIMRDQRELNYNIRGFAKHKTPVPFVQQKNSLP